MTTSVSNTLVFVINANVQITHCQYHLTLETSIQNFVQKSPESPSKISKSRAFSHKNLREDKFDIIS